MDDDDVFDDEDGGGGGIEEEIICAEGAPEWVVTFGDMMSLLLTFFILLLSFASMDALKFKQMAGSIAQALGIESDEQVVEIAKGKDLVKIDFNIDFNAKKVKKKLKRELDPLSLKRQKGAVNVEIFESYRGIVVLAPASDIFVEGTDRLRESALPFLDYIAGEAATYPHEIALETRASQGVPRNQRFADTWSLTASQAVSVAQYLRDVNGVDPRRLRPVGRGHAPPSQKPGTPGPPVAQSTVEILFLSDKLVPGK